MVNSLRLKMVERELFLLRRPEEKTHFEKKCVLSEEQDEVTSFGSGGLPVSSLLFNKPEQTKKCVIVTSCLDLL